MKGLFRKTLGREGVWGVKASRQEYLAAHLFSTVPKQIPRRFLLCRHALMESGIVAVLQACRFWKGWQTNAFMFVNPVDLIADGLFFLYFDLFL